MRVDTGGCGSIRAQLQAGYQILSVRFSRPLISVTGLRLRENKS